MRKNQKRRSGFGYQENAKDHWNTPPELVEALGEFDLDPCAGYLRMLAKDNYRLPEQDGLLLPWKGRVWCNPPYGKETAKWFERMALHDNGLMLIFARTETEAFRPAWIYGAALYFLYKRITFIQPDGKPGEYTGGAPSVLVAFGQNNIDALRKLKRDHPEWDGALVTKWNA